MEEAARWYVVSVYSGLENSVVETIKEQATKKGLLNQFEELFVPSEQVIEMRRGKKTTKNRTYFPGYILVKVEMTDEIWSLICSVPRVNGFLGAKNPLPVSEAEVSRILAQVQESHERPRSTISFEVGEVIKVADGPFTSFTGTIESVEDVRERLTVSVMIFGRPTPIDLDFGQVEKN
ncbi:transcription termination/antitermination protein NusG [Alphaproteobacteria bacterium]|nr:transcription termination/antitermination protein NusG [Alphaproteobacteria bacterium]GHT00253.1 transcription termination/antitermination protein NusG [Alphaproteobacteria bacterium]